MEQELRSDVTERKEFHQKKFIIIKVELVLMNHLMYTEKDIYSLINMRDIKISYGSRNQR